LYNWFRITSPAPKNADVVEVTGKQFNWIIRYPGKDGKFGNKQFKLIDDINTVGMDFHDRAGMDDFIYNGEIHLEVGKPVLFKINSRDVIHDVGIPYFSVKMDAVPGMPTHFWFTPLYTTEQMAQKTGNPDFKYEMACDALCGRGHSSMKAVIVVDTPEKFREWYDKQPSFYDANIKGTAEETKLGLNTNTTNAASVAVN